MYDILITFRSLTAAQQARQACWERGISASLTKAPVGVSAKGCGYALKVSATALGQVSLILRLEHIPFSNAYRSTANGLEAVIL